MLLHILRHAEAEATISSDRERRLTLHGHRQAKAVGDFCLKHGIFPEVILTSPVVRAKQTTEEFVAVTKQGTVIEVPWMSCGMESQKALQELHAYKNFQHIMLVGHEPDLSRLIATLVGTSTAISFDIGKASLTSLAVKKIEVGCGVLRWLIPVELIS